MASGTYDVVIVGAGFAGLSAGDRLNLLNAERAREGRQPIRYVILEGAMRPGGRTLTQSMDSTYLDFGGQYLAPRFIDASMNGYRQDAAWSLVDRFGIEVFDTHLPEDRPNLYMTGAGQVSQFPGNFPGESDPRVIALLTQIETFVADMRPYVGRPWAFPGAEQLDAVSVADWMDANVPDPAMKELFAIAVRSAFSIEPRQCSLLHFLHYSASCGSFAAFENVKGGGDAVRFRFGTGDLINRLAQSVGPDRIMYGTRVQTIKHDPAGCLVVTDSSRGPEQWRARRVLVAMSPSASEVIGFEPPLPEARRTLTKGMPMAHTIKGFAIFERPWWRDRFSGYALSARGPIDWVMDNTWVSPTGELGRASLMTFIVGDEAVKWGNARTTPEARKEAVLDQLAELFQASRDDLRAELIRYVDFDWSSDEWGRGCPAGCIAPGILTQRLDGVPIGEALYRPVGRIHWGGSETGLRWMGGYMNGAIDSGVRAANEVAALV